MPSALRFRLYPSRDQEAKMLRTLEACRRLWNDALSHRRDRWQSERKPTSYNYQQWILTAECHEDPELGSLHSQVAQDVLHRLDRAFKAFFEHWAGYPRFKKFREWWSFTYPQTYHGSVKSDPLRKRLFLSKVGNVPVVFHRQLPKDSRMKTCTVVREPDGKWFASLVFEEVVPLQNVPSAVATTRAPVGIDLGLRSLITTSDGEKVEHPRLLRKAEKRLKHIQRVFSRKQKGSNNWFKARQRLASQHACVRRQRADFNHKLSTRLVREHSLVAFEDLKVRNMVRNHSLAKSIQDAGWGQLVRLTEYKASKAGRLVVRVEPAYSTHECFYCGSLNKVSLEMREFVCGGCGRTLDRDVNAARIVLKRAIAQVGQDMPEPKPVETGPLPLQTTGAASLVVEAGTTRATDVRALEAHGLIRGRLSQV
ncbi:MAG: transposase [Thaumarchaeota archaeon]|nr:transposase [Nitrososphaerota archaeon]